MQQGQGARDWSSQWDAKLRAQQKHGRRRSKNMHQKHRRNMVQGHGYKANKVQGEQVQYISARQDTCASGGCTMQVSDMQGRERSSAECSECGNAQHSGWAHEASAAHPRDQRGQREAAAAG